MGSEDRCLVENPMDKNFNPVTYERKWQKHWAREGFFRAQARSERASFSIMIPPPNVTGKLHIGHALQSTIQDLLVRWKRMQGFNALWLPGTDHAGIATQLMVERQLAKEGVDKTDLGREGFLKRVWEWKEEFQGNIREQLDLMGASCDWDRERFTLDEGLSKAVRKAFVSLYQEGLIYRAEYMVNWSPALDTAISDLEVEMKTVVGKLYHIAYLVEGTAESIQVATTRPETMLGDTAVAYHPDDPRYRHLAGKSARIPLIDRLVPFISDPSVERDFGTGLVKITPAHDHADFELGRRHDLPSIQVIDRVGKMTPAAGSEFAGLDRREARSKIVELLKADGSLNKIEEYSHSVGHCQRSGVPIEPVVSTQWFADVSGMAARGLEAVEKGDLALIPDSWESTWAHWLTNIRPWCISRQLWWGHRIPAWFTPDGEIIVAEDEAAAQKMAGQKRLTRDPDVLDTWFSSALWPFSTLGWPDSTADLKTFYPTDVLVTGFDILFFWVARMVMMGLHLTNSLPFKAVHLTGLVRDASGQKMSKTRGNTVDPLELIDAYGADAMRFTLAALDVPGRDIPLDLERMAGYRRFGNKIWNAVRFALARVEEAEIQDDLETESLDVPERWILSRLSRTSENVNEKLEDFRFDEACGILYHFLWNELCDWYIEIVKPALSGEAPRPMVGEVLLTCLDRSLRLLHPIMPFLTEELWQKIPGHEAIHPETICLAPYPQRVERWIDAEAESELQLLMDLVTAVRALRAELKLQPNEPVNFFLETSDSEAEGWLRRQDALLVSLCKLAEVKFGRVPENASRVTVGALRFGIVVPDREMTTLERSRMESELRQVETQIAGASRLLSDGDFLKKAPAEIVARNRLRLDELTRRRSGLQEDLA